MTTRNKNQKETNVMYRTITEPKHTFMISMAVDGIVKQLQQQKKRLLRTEYVHPGI